MYVNPGLFTDSIVSMKDDPNFPEIGCTSIIGQGKYDITINSEKIKDMLEKSWLKGQVGLEDVITAVELHEVGHIKYNSFEIAPYLNTNLSKLISNIFEDARLEYRFSNEFPQYSMFFDLSISLIKSNLVANQSAGNTLDKLTEYMNEMFNIVRFGSTNSKDEEFISLIVSLCTINRRGTEIDTLKISWFLEEYLLKKLGLNKQYVDSNTVINQTGIGKDINSIGQKINNDVDKKKELKDKLKKAKKNKKKGKDDKENFYDCIISKYKRQILELRKIFKRILSQKKFVPSMEGELNLKKQQELYINSKTMEETKVYLVNKLAKSGADVCVIRDISGSTSSFKDKYAEMSLVCLSSLESIHGMRTMMIDFSNHATVVKNFEDKLVDCEIKAVSEGGTMVCSALEKLKEQKFSSGKRVCIIITDGEYSDTHYAEKMIKELEIKLGIKFCRILIENGQNSLRVEDLPSEVGKFILKEIK